MNSFSNPSSQLAVTDVYTDLHGMQALKTNKDDAAALKKISQQFESMFINLLLKNVRSANKVFNQDGLFDSHETEFYREMHDNQLALTLAHREGFGIAEAMYRQLASAQGLEDNQVRQSISELQAYYPAEQKSSDSNQVSDNPTNATALVTESGTRQALADSPSSFIERVKDSAKVAAKKLGVEKEILIAQAALETGWGKYVFANERGDSTHNLFNIKADSRWHGDAIETNTLEYLGGALNSVSAKFRSYASIEEAFDDFSQFLQSGERYQAALASGEKSLGFIRGIHQAGYATDPDYVEKVSAVYQRVKALLKDQTSSSGL